jgi:GNAT superfamily N-acetyltransferase
MQQLTRADSNTAAEVLARAFVTDPLWRHLFPHVTQRVLLLRQSFRATLPFSTRNEHVYGVGHPLDGVAIWRGPTQRGSADATVLNIHLLTLLCSPFVRTFRHTIPIFAHVDRMHNQYAAEPHYYLRLIGIAPPAQGKGRASLLIKPLLAQADAERTSVYTETMVPSNVPMYEHYGFVCREQFPIPGTDLAIWALYRPRRA